MPRKSTRLHPFRLARVGAKANLPSPSLAPVEDNSDGEGDIPFTDAKSEQPGSPSAKEEDDDDEEDGEDVYVGLPRATSVEPVS